jgi:hypothetical protein
MTKATKTKRPYVKVYFSNGEAQAIQAAIDLLSEASGDSIKPKEYAKLAILTYTEAIGQKHADNMAAEKKDTMVVSDEGFDAMMASEDNEPNDKLKELMKDD